MHRLAFFLLVLLLPVASMAQETTADPCTLEYHLAQVQCLGKKIEMAELELAKIFDATLAQLPDVDPNDDARKSKTQLRKAQDAWCSYRNQHCAFIGGIQGGSSLWITHFAGDCALEETNKRIEFFKHVPWGDH